MVIGSYTRPRSDASSGGVNMHKKLMSRCSWVMVGPSASGDTGPSTVCAIPLSSLNDMSVLPGCRLKGAVARLAS